MKKLISAISCMLALCLTACSQPTAGADTGISLRSGGTLVLRVNPEIAVEYDEKGLVTGVVARNEDAIAVIDDRTGLIGGNVRDAVTQLVAANVKKLILKSKSVAKGCIELNYKVRMKDADSDFINTLSDLPGVSHTVMVSYNGDYMS